MSQDDFRLSEAVIRAVMSSASIRHARNELVFHDLTGSKRGCELQTFEKKKWHEPGKIFNPHWEVGTSAFTSSLRYWHKRLSFKFSIHALAFYASIYMKVVQQLRISPFLLTAAEVFRVHAWTFSSMLKSPPDGWPAAPGLQLRQRHQRARQTTISNGSTTRPHGA